MNLVFIIDDDENSVAHLAATMTSILENTNRIWNISIIYESLSENDRRKMNELMKEYPSKLEYIQVDEKELEKAMIHKGNSLKSEKFLKLCIPEILKTTDRVIYLENDTIVLKSLETLYNMDLEDKSIGVIPEGRELQRVKLERLKLNKDRVYFNTGILVMDLEKLRANKKFQKVLEFCEYPNRDLDNFEQDSMNIVFENDFTVNDIVWNYTLENSEEDERAIDDIGIIHYTEKIKPWDCRSISKYKKFYWKYLRKTPWWLSKEENLSIKNILERELKILKSKIKNI